MARRRRRSTTTEQTILFPAAGLERQHAYRLQPPFSSPEARNVRAVGRLEQRDRGGSRPGLVTCFSDQIGSDVPIRALGEVTMVGGSMVYTQLFTDDDFERDSFGTTPWQTVCTDYYGNVTLPDRIVSGVLFPEYGDDWQAAQQVTNLLYPTSEDPTFPTCAVTLFLTKDGTYYRSTVKLFVHCDDGDGEYHGGVARLKGRIGPPHVVGEFTVYEQKNDTGFQEWTYDFPSNPAYSQPSGIGDTAFKVVFAANYVKITFNEYVLYEGAVHDMSPIDDATSDVYVGFCLDRTTTGTGTQIDRFLLARNSSYQQPQQRQSLLVASADGDFYYTSSPAQGSDFKRWKIAGTVTTVDAGSPDTIFTSDDLSDTTPDDDDYIVPYFVEWLTGDNAETVSVVDSYDSSSQEVTLADALTSNITIGDTFEVYPNIVSDQPLQMATRGQKVYIANHGLDDDGAQRKPLIFDPSTMRVDIWGVDQYEEGDSGYPGAKGTMPSGCPLICRYRDRMVLAGSPAHVWYMSRQGDPHDFDYGADSQDMQRAVAGTSADAGMIAEPITALAPFSDDYLIFGCAHQLWVLRGDPALGGQIDNISYTVGIVGARAWCHGPHGEFIFLSMDGLYYLAPGGDMVLQSLSRDKLPEELSDIDTELDAVSLAWDVYGRGVHIYRTPLVAQ